MLFGVSNTGGCSSTIETRGCCDGARTFFFKVALPYCSEHCKTLMIWAPGNSMIPAKKKPSLPSHCPCRSGQGGRRAFLWRGGKLQWRQKHVWSPQQGEFPCTHAKKGEGSPTKGFASRLPSAQLNHLRRALRQCAPRSVPSFRPG